MAQARPVLEAAGARGVNLVERSDLLTAAACLERADFFVGNDSGLMHLAAAAGTPTLGLFGPSPEVRYRPWGPHAGYVRTPESFEALTGARSEEHTSELQSLMRISYAVFCLKKK